MNKKKTLLALFGCVISTVWAADDDKFYRCVQSCADARSNCGNGADCGFRYTQCENQCRSKYGLLELDRDSARRFVFLK